MRLFKMRLLLICLIFLQLSNIILAEWTYIGNYVESFKVKDNVFTFKCTNSVVQLEICTEDIIRVRMSQNGVFKLNEPYVVIKYQWEPVKFKIKDGPNYLEIETEKIIIEINKNPFRISFLEEDRNKICEDFSEGGMAWDNEKVICRKTMFIDEHFFGLGQRYEKSDLRGMKKELWVTENVTYIPFYMSTNGYGIFFHNTWKSEFDFTQNPLTFSSPGGAELDYYYMYGPSFKKILDSYTAITGKAPMPPKWAFGLYYSKWDNQGGQNGIIADVKSCRDVKNWPLDAVRIHSKGCSQNFWASPNTNWPDEGWGSFPSVDKLVLELQKLNCHPIFWESPGVMNGCNMYYEGESNQFFILNEEGSTWNGQLGSGLFGALIDFSNPEACNLWAKYHKYIIDFGSEGAAGDHGEEVFGKMYSGYSKMTGEEYHNLYSMLYDKASWDAYKLYNPNKRSIIFGRSTWAGCQRYPMQGTQDSHEERKDIHGEMMGALNFGLSGVPYRTYTDNVTRGLLKGNNNFPIVRLSQYLCLNIGGERTGILWTGNDTADNNYRFYGQLRYQLIPYIYSYSWQTHKTGLPIMRALVLEYQFDKNTYEANCEYLLGKEILIAPFWSDTTFQREIYLPGGEWIDFWDETVYKGMQKIYYKTSSIDKVPIFVKAGAIIPLAPANQKFMDEKKQNMTYHIYPKGSSSFQLYEDDGITYDYEKGIYSLTNITYKETKEGMDIIKSKPGGKYLIPERDNIFCIHKKMEVKLLKVNNKEIKRIDNINRFEKESEGWLYDKNKNVLWCKIKGNANEAIIITIN